MIYINQSDAFERMVGKIWPSRIDNRDVNSAFLCSWQSGNAIYIQVTLPHYNMTVTNTNAIAAVIGKAMVPSQARHCGILPPSIHMAVTCLINRSFTNCLSEGQMMYFPKVGSIPSSDQYGKQFSKLIKVNIMLN